MVNLAELVIRVGFKVNHKRAAEVVLDLNHVASHGAVCTLDQLLGELRELLWVSESCSVCSFENFSSTLLSCLLLEFNCENVVLDRLQ